MAGLSPAHLFIILVVALIVVGPGKLPEVAAAIGRSVREFQKATSGITDTVTGAMSGVMAPPANTPQPMQPAPPAQSYYAAGQAYPAPAAPAPVNYPIMGVAAPAPVNYPIMGVAAPAPVNYPIMGVAAPAPAAPAPTVPAGEPVPNATEQQPPSSPSVG
jgi:TatA/E family protein of Tat protein translocase